MGVVEKLNSERITIRLGQERHLTLLLDDSALRRLDLAYALNAYAAQGITTRHGIVVVDSREGPLASSRTLAVALTRIANKPTLVVDSASDFARSLRRNSVDKISALDVFTEREAARNAPVPQLTHVPEKTMELGL